MTVLRSPIVGAHFRPPAKLLLAALPAGAALQLEPEPGNPYDALAIKVLVDAREIPEGQHGRLAEELPGSGSSLDEVLGAEAPWQLGYVCASTNAKELAKAPGCVGNADVGELLARGPAKVVLAFGPDGRPQVLVEALREGQDS